MTDFLVKLAPQQSAPGNPPLGFRYFATLLVIALSTCPTRPGFLSDNSTLLNITNFNVFWFIIPVFHFTKGKSLK